ncbi:glutamate formimidoyltransferase [Candidatus Acetothermia bacterium]|nr:glutamate formimidoyltransferase [Candidatus Acetothermia bacterium]MBI3642516.1 glutamate formimidoyltransferase [Candidatus Acetothermia bacterium]
MSMNKIIECIPNISEGRDQVKIDMIASAVKQFPGVLLLDVDSDPDHNRTVMTFAGEPEGVERAILALVAEAAQQIDLRKHTGEHPRMGAVDVVPFVPIKNSTMEECIDLSKRVGEKIWKQLKIPVYLYEASATTPSRENLAEIRKGQFEGFSEKIKMPEWAPDFGERTIHPSAGVVAVGARMPLIAFNVNLGTDKLEIAQEIAKAVRHMSGGLRYVKALGFKIEERGIVQVSMNMTHFRKTPLFRVFTMIQREAERYGVPVIGSEIVGLVPREALLQAASYFLQLEKFESSQVLEEQIELASRELGNS